MDSIESIRKGGIPERGKDAALVSFVRAGIRSRGFVSDTELKVFFDHGFTPRNALEVVLGITLKIMTNCSRPSRA